MCAAALKMKKIYLAVLQWINPSGKNATSRTFRQLTEKRPKSRANKIPLLLLTIRRTLLKVTMLDSSFVVWQYNYKRKTVLLLLLLPTTWRRSLKGFLLLECCSILPLNLPNIYSFLHTWWKRRTYLLLLLTTTKTTLLLQCSLDC